MSAAAGKQADPLERWHHDLPQKFELECASSGVDIHSQKHGTIFKALDFDSVHAKGWIDKYDEFFYPRNHYIKAADAQLPTDQVGLRTSEYTFLGLCNNRGRILGPPDLGYLVGLADSSPNWRIRGG